MDIGAITLRMAADTGGLRTDMDKAKQVVSDATTQMAQSTGKATAEMDKYTLSVKQQREAALAGAAAQAEYMDKLQAMAATVGKTRLELMQMQASTLGMSDVAAPYIAKIEEATKKTHELSLANAGVTRELGVLGREAANGNWSRFEGSLTVLAARTGLLEMAFSATGLSIAAVVAVVGVFVMAVIKGALESEKLNNSLVLTGNYAGITAGQFDSMAASIANAANVGVRKGREALQDLVSTGKVTGEALDILGKDMIRMSELSGEKLSDIAKDYAKMPEGVAKWAEKHNQSMHFMDVAQYEHIRALEDTGKAQEAMITVGKLLDEHLNTQAKNLGIVSRAWGALGRAASGAWDAMLGIGRTETVEDRLAKATANIAKANGPKGSGDTNWAIGHMDELLAAQSVAQSDLREQKRQAGHTAEMARINEEGIAASDWAEKELQHFDKRIGMQDALDKAQKNFDALSASGHALTIDQQQKIVEGIQKQYTEKTKAGKVVVDEDAKLIASTRDHMAAMGAEADAATKLTPVQREIATLYETISNSKIKYKLETLLTIDALMQEKLTEEERITQRDRQIKAMEEENKQRERLLTNLGNQAGKFDDELRKIKDHTAGIGQSKEAVAALTAQRDLDNASAQESAAISYLVSTGDAKVYEAMMLVAKGLREIAAARKEDGIVQNVFDEAKKAEQAWARTEKTIENGLDAAITNGGAAGFKKLLSDVKLWFAHLVLQPIIQPIAQFGASMMNPGAPGAASSLGGLGGLFSGLSGGAGDTMRNFGTMGSLENIGTLASAGTMSGMMGAVGAALPYIGVAMAVASLLSKSGGGPKTEGGFSAGGLSIAGADIGGSQQGSVRGDVSGAQSISQGISQSYETLATQLGLVNKKLDVGVFFSKDNAAGGTSLTQLQITSSAGYNRGATAGGIENVGRTDPEFQAAITDATSQLLLQALKNSDLAAQYKQMLNGIADNAGSAEIQAAIAHVTAAKTQQAQLTEQIYQMTATAEEKLARTRLQERAAIDPLNAALLEQLYAKQDAMQAEAVATAAATQAAKDQAAAQTALAAAMTALKSATDAALTGLQNSITAARQVAAQQVQDLTALSTLLGSSIGQLTGTTSGGAGSSFIAKALSAAKTTGYLPDVTQLQGAITGATAGVNNTGNYKSAQEQEFARMVLAGQLSQLKDLTDPQLTAAQQQVKYLDGILEDAQKQVDALRGIDNSVKSVAVAIAALRAAILNEKTGGAAAAAVAAVKAAVGPNFAGIQSGGSAAPILTDAMMHPGFAYAGGVVPNQEWADKLGTWNDPRGNNWTGPSFADGTPQILQTGLAMVHKDEAIIPASAAQKWRDGGDDDGGKLAARIEQLIQVCTQVVINTRTTADVFRQAQTVSGGMALAVTTVAAGT